MREIDTSTIGGRIKASRLRKGYSQEQLAELIISEVEGKTVTIHSKSSNPIISQKALLSVGKPKAVVSVKAIQ